jgi:predicted secreted Zn-dependent protease
MEGDVNYLRRRASEERTSALNAHDPRARKAHSEMAERYEDLVRAIVARDRHLGIDLYDLA